MLDFFFALSVVEGKYLDQKKDTLGVTHNFSNLLMFTYLCMFEILLFQYERRRFLKVDL